MEVAAGLIKVKPGVEGSVQNWTETMRERVDEALITLREEGVEIESWFELEIEEDKYLLWYMRAESIEKIWSAFEQSEHEIDHFHLNTMTAISEGSIPTSPLVDLCTNGS